MALAPARLLPVVPATPRIACWRLVPARRATWQPGLLRHDPNVGGWSWEDGVEATDLPRDVPRAYWTPPALDAHTHLGDAFLRPERDRLPRSIPELVAPPDGVKHQRLRAAPPAALRDAIRTRADRMTSLGTAACLDFREGGTAGLRLLHEALAGAPMQAHAFARPAPPASDAAAWSDEAGALLAGPTAGLGLSGLSDLPAPLLEAAADECRRAGKPLALHLAEARHEPAEEALRYDAKILVHLVHTRGAEWDAIADARALAVACPTSNRFFGLAPPLKALHRMHREQGLATAFGTDNAMLSDGDLRDEARLAVEIHPHGDLDWVLASLTWTPWRHLGLGPEPGHPGLLWGVDPACPGTHPEDTPLGRTRAVWERPVWRAPGMGEATSRA